MYLAVFKERVSKLAHFRTFCQEHKKKNANQSVRGVFFYVGIRVIASGRVSCTPCAKPVYLIGTQMIFRISNRAGTADYSSTSSIFIMP